MHQAPGRRPSIVAILCVILLAACQASASLGTASPDPVASAGSAPSPSIPGPTFHATPTPAPSPTADVPKPPVGAAGGIYWATIDPAIAPSLADIEPRVWVPIERGERVIAIDPRTFEVVERIRVGAYPEHVTPSWDGQLLYVNNMNSDSMSVIDPRRRELVDTVRVPMPYNLYFTPDGTQAIVVHDMTKGAPKEDNGLRFYTNPGFEELGFVPIEWPGADHLDFSADGAKLYVSCEYSGRVVVVDVATRRIVNEIVVGGYPTDVRLAPDGRYLFVANQLLDMLTVIDTTTDDVVELVDLERGAHGLAMSRDATILFVTNRIAASLSAVDVATWNVRDTWEIGGSPDMITVSADGTQLWISNRWDASVSVVDSRTGAVIRTIDTGAYPHGLAYWPLPGRYSLGHNGNMR
jgi:YVTN family beta-propeller protein